MNLEYLNNPPNTDYDLPVVSHQMELPINKMRWEDFEKLCLRMVEYVEGFKRNDCDIFGRQGQKQDGIDIYAKKASDLYYTFQCKKYDKITTTDIDKIISEFEKGEWYNKTKKFYICTSADFSDVKLQKKYEEVKTNYSKKGKEIEKWDYSFINRILKTYPQIVYDFFGEEWCKKYCGEQVYENIIVGIDFSKVEKSFNKASLFLSRVKNYFEKEPTTHISRKETQKIIDWVTSDLKFPKKNLLVLEGDKGMGKSVILKDVYAQLKDEKHFVLGIKADKYYATTPKELENKIFLDDSITFSTVLGALNANKNQLVVIIDQLDALSQTLSSNREYIQTYNRIINELIDEKNIRIIISSRTFDLQYDAELSVYKSNEYHNVKASYLDSNDVVKTLKKFDITCSQEKVLELLRTPNQLEIFCKLPNKNKINLNTLSSLKDLYDELWESLIINKSELKLSEFLYSLAVEMYEKQQIISKRRLNNQFNAEIHYLLSNQLIVKDESDIQFFHQTFYDYCFSRQFVEKGNDIFNYLNDNEQNLEVRSIVKMVFEYLREYDHEKYISNAKSIINSSKYRFHIKSLIISNLGILTNPSREEKELLSRYILKNILFKDVFIHSIFSKEWTEYILKSDVIRDLLFVKKTPFFKLQNIYNKQSVLKLKFLEKLDFQSVVEYRKNMAFRFLRNNINIAPLSVMQYLDNLEEFLDKTNFNERVLIGLDDWSDKKLLPYFEKYIRYNYEGNGRNFWYYEILAKIFQHHEKYVFCLIRPIFKSIFSKGDSWSHCELQHEQEELLKKLYKKNSEDTFNFVFDVYSNVIDENKDLNSFKEINSPLYHCTKFLDNLSTPKDAYIVFEKFMLKHLKLKIVNKEYFTNFFQKHKNTDSVDILRLIALTLKDEKPLFKNEVFELLNIIFEKNGFNGYDNSFQLTLRKVIGLYFSSFSENEKNKISEILLSIKHPYDFKYGRQKVNHGKEKVSFYGRSKKQFLFIKQLPKSEVWQIPLLKKKYLEFFRKFGDVDSNKALDVSSINSYGVGPPLSQKAYVKMDLKNWRNSFTKFGDDYKRGRGPLGGKLEHSRAFGESVTSNPDKYYHFIQELFNDKNMPLDYLSSGIDGLIKAKYEPEKVKSLHNKFIQLDLDRVNILYAVWYSDYLIKHNLVDDLLVSFLSNNAINHPNPNKPMNKNDPSFDSLNTVRGASIHRIMQCYQHKKYENIIFKTVEKASSDPQVSVRVAVMQELAFLNYLDLDRSFKVFMNLINQNDTEVLKNSIRTSYYFNTKFHKEMSNYFEKIIESKELHEKGNVIVLSWLNEKISDMRLFKKFTQASDEAKLCALSVAEENLFDKNAIISKRSFNILLKFLYKNSEDFATAYSGIILRKFKDYNFEESYEFLLKYSKSNLCMKQPSYFLQLLITCAKNYPIKCLNLIENLNYSSIPNIQRRGHYDKEPVQLILAIYSKLNMDLSNNKKTIKKTLDIFDDMLKHNHLRSSLNQAIDLIT